MERTGRDPSARERAAIERPTAADTRGGKSNATLDELRTRCWHEAAGLGIDADTITADITTAARQQPRHQWPTVGDVVGELAGSMSAWHRMGRAAHDL